MFERYFFSISDISCFKNNFYIWYYFKWTGARWRNRDWVHAYHYVLQGWRKGKTKTHYDEIKVNLAISYYIKTRRNGPWRKYASWYWKLSQFKVDEMAGANKAKLVEKIEELRKKWYTVQRRFYGSPNLDVLVELKIPIVYWPRLSPQLHV